ncbi:hypothetical protein B0H34DRAFT_399143 [Crassisporium funariophilum]|nr:hypothetical protein B0H34DRAFT_399143 [Crassisporium funariophilum]
MECCLMNPKSKVDGGAAQRVASLFLSDSSDPNSQEFVLNASGTNQTQIFLVDTSASTSRTPVASSTSSNGPLSVTLQKMLGSGSKQSRYCMTYDPKPPKSAPLMMEKCFDMATAAETHKSQKFMYDTTSGDIWPTWFAGEDDGKTDAMSIPDNAHNSTTLRNGTQTSSTNLATSTMLTPRKDSPVNAQNVTLVFVPAKLSAEYLPEIQSSSSASMSATMTTTVTVFNTASATPSSVSGSAPPVTTTAGALNVELVGDSPDSSSAASSTRAVSSASASITNDAIPASTVTSSSAAPSGSIDAAAIASSIAASAAASSSSFVAAAEPTASTSMLASASVSSSSVVAAAEATASTSMLASASVSSSSVVAAAEATASTSMLASASASSSSVVGVAEVTASTSMLASASVSSSSVVAAAEATASTSMLASVSVSSSSVVAAAEATSVSVSASSAQSSASVVSSSESSVPTKVAIVGRYMRHRAAAPEVTPVSTEPYKWMFKASAD